MSSNDDPFLGIASSFQLLPGPHQLIVGISWSIITASDAHDAGHAFDIHGHCPISSTISWGPKTWSLWSENNLCRRVIWVGEPTDRRKFRSQTSDNMERWKSRGGKSQRGGVNKWEDQRRERVRSKKRVREKVGKSRFTVFFQWFGAPEGRKGTSLGRRVRSQLARWKTKSCTPLWREARFEVKMYKAHQRRTTFGSWAVKKSARCCGAKHISKWKCTKHTSFGPLLEVETSKKCAPLWREARFQVKNVKNWRIRMTFGRSDVEKVHAVVAWSIFPSQKCKKTRGSDHFLTFRCRKVHAVVARSTCPSQKCQKLRGSGHFFNVQMSKKCTLTNLTNLTHVTNSTNTTNLTNKLTH